jgi:ribosomal protein S18 acetylase RimI-like enzyme
MPPVISLARADTARDIAAVQDLFREYVFRIGRELNISVGYQDWEGEMAAFPDRYLFLLLAKVDDAPAAAVALKRLNETECEMKRLYCRDAFRCLGLARRLSERLIIEARALGFGAMRLDTHVSMTPAITLYESLGFTPSAPHNAPGNDGTLFFAKDL